MSQEEQDLDFPEGERSQGKSELSHHDEILERMISKYDLDDFNESLFRENQSYSSKSKKSK